MLLGNQFFPARKTKVKMIVARQPAFQLDMVVDRPILLLGIAVFLPHGENIQGDVSIFVGARVKVCDETSEETSREKVSLTNKFFSWTSSAITDSGSV